ncbi:MAG: ChbG/HpnK family deacetylase [Candidatus Acidiferrales bacterium]
MERARLIVNGDDFGMSRGITEGIILAQRYGFLTSASLMVNMPAAEYAIGRMAKKAPELAVGVHLNICQGRPVMPPREVASLVDAEGNFEPPARMIRKLWRGTAAGNEIEAEFRAQIRWLKDRGVAPTHADSHHHMHIYPAAAGPFARALAAEGIRCARAPRCSAWPKSRLFRAAFWSSAGGPYEGGPARRILVGAYRGALQGFFFHGLDMPTSRISFHSCDRRDPAALGERWKAAIESLHAGTFELACHPGLFERGFSEADPIHEQREEELRWLTDPEWLDAVERSGVQLITYSDLAEIRAAHPSAAEAAAA